MLVYFILQFVKCGYAGSHFPAHIFPSMVGRPILRAVNKIGDIEVEVCQNYSNFIKNRNLLLISENTKETKFEYEKKQKQTKIPIYFTEFTCRCKFVLCPFHRNAIWITYKHKHNYTNVIWMHQNLTETTIQRNFLEFFFFFLEKKNSFVLCVFLWH